MKLLKASSYKTQAVSSLTPETGARRQENLYKLVLSVI